MGTPISTVTNLLSKSYFELKTSDMEEEKEFAADLRTVLVQLVGRLKPLLKYIDEPIGNHRAVTVCATGGGTLLLSREAVWGQKSKDGVVFEGNEWESFPLRHIVDSLTEKLARAEGERQARLAAITDARATLQRVSAILEAPQRPDTGIR